MEVWKGKQVKLPTDSSRVGKSKPVADDGKMRVQLKNDRIDGNYRTVACDKAPTASCLQCKVVAP